MNVLVPGRRFLPDLMAFALLYLALALPDRPDLLASRAWAVLPVELPLICIAIVLVYRLSSAFSQVARFLLSAALAVTLIIRVADIGMYGALNRPFNFAYDLPLIEAGWNVLVGSRGYAVSGAYAAGAALVSILTLIVLWWASGRIARVSAWTGSALAVPIVAAMAFLPNSTLASRVVAEHGAAFLQAREDIAQLEREAADDQAAGVPAERMLASLRGRDVIFAFVESYGRSTIDNPDYAGITRKALSDIDKELKARGLGARSAWLTSPTFGGQSWLAHSTFLSGLWIGNEGRYGALMRSKRQTLLTLGREAGWRTIGVMPAITQPWPESKFYGFDRVLAARDLGYFGKPFNWVTMPDQFTLSAFETMELRKSPRQPVMAGISLISSHAPWTPVPKLVPWDAVGDGRIFDTQAEAGPTPRELWAEPDAVRKAFVQTIDYALRTVSQFAARQNGTPPLVVVVGDHQPAAFVSGTESNRDVPIHIIGDPATLLLLDDWGWAEGMLPDAGSPVWRMDAFRDNFLRAYSPAPHGVTGKDGPA